MGNVLKKLWDALLGQTGEEGPVAADEPKAVSSAAAKSAPVRTQQPEAFAPRRELQKEAREETPRSYPPTIVPDSSVPNEVLQETARSFTRHEAGSREKLEILARQGSNAASQLLQMLEAAEGGDAEAQLMLGREYHYGSILPRNYRMAARCYLQALQSGQKDARALLRELLYQHHTDLIWILNESEELRRLNNEVTAERLAERRSRVEREQAARRAREEERTQRIRQRMQESAQERQKRKDEEDERSAYLAGQAQRMLQNREEQAARTQAARQRMQTQARLDQTQKLEQVRLEADRRRDEEHERTQQANWQTRQNLAQRRARVVREAQQKAEEVLDTVRARDERLAAAQAEKERRSQAGQERREELLSAAKKAVAEHDVKTMESIAAVFRSGEENLRPDWPLYAWLEEQIQLNRGDPQALDKVGDHFFYGRNGFPQDLNRAFDFYESSGNSSRMESVLRQWKEQGDEESVAAHIDRYFDACSDPRQRSVICSNVEYGYWCAPDPEKAYALALKNKDQTLAENIAFRISEYYREKKQADKSFTWLLRSGDQVNTISRRVLAEAALYESGTEEKPQDLERAYDLYCAMGRSEDAARVAELLKKEQETAAPEQLHAEGDLAPEKEFSGATV